MRELGNNVICCVGFIYMVKEEHKGNIVVELGGGTRGYKGLYIVDAKSIFGFCLFSSSSSSSNSP